MRLLLARPGDRRLTSWQVHVGENKGAPRTDRGSGLVRCRATFAWIHLSRHQQLKDNRDHGAILVGEKMGSAQSRSRFWTCALPCDFCLDSPVMPSAVNTDAAIFCVGQSGSPGDPCWREEGERPEPIEVLDLHVAAQFLPRFTHHAISSSH